ncbi:hypothetical protein B296_00023492 [Ensete ventricosum]|uniref:Uncharacterized protein n=1 Tax=Ensete ventricosum TaxID=4639 RepID=A0A426ZVZ7_ENSVE|nr:hypothetical protein B296_00023492 [Ensete ventricosum]
MPQESTCHFSFWLILYPRNPCGGACTFGIEPGHVDSPVNGSKKYHFSTRRRGLISQEHPPMNPLSKRSNEEVSSLAPNTFDMKDNHLPSLKWTPPPWHKHRDTIGVCSMTSVNPLWGRVWGICSSLSMPS